MSQDQWVSVEEYREHSSWSDITAYIIGRIAMEVKPIPKPRSSLTESKPVPAPRRILAPTTTSPMARSSSPTSESGQSEKSDDQKSTGENTRGNHEFFRNLGTSSRQLKDEISERVTVKGRAVISSTRNASIRLERSVKNLLTRRLSSLNQDDVVGQDHIQKKLKDPIEEDRCVSMPTNDIFSSISFYSPLSGNLRSVKNEEDLSARHSPPPPVYPPPPLPDESIYDELQSVTSGSSGRYDTLSSTVSDKVERDFPDSFNLLSFARNQVKSRLTFFIRDSLFFFSRSNFAICWNIQLSTLETFTKIGFVPFNRIK